MKVSRMNKGLLFLVTLCLCMPSISGFALEENDYQKDESVFVICNSDGSVENTTVTEWLHSDNGLTHIEDKSNLTNIKNISGDEIPVINGNEISWESKSNDIYYQGNSNQPLPFSLNVSYKLDGNSISANDLVGKSGQLEMVITLTNNSIETKVVNGKTIEVSPLFPIVMIVNMPSDQFKNVTIDSGTIVAEGKNQIVTMTSVLGLQQCLDSIDSAQLDDIKDKLNSTFTITANVSDMDVPSVMLASATGSSDTQLDNVDMSELTSGISELKEATTTILDGTVQLKNANIELNDKMGEFQGKVNEFNDGVGKVNDGSSKLVEGSKTLSNGISSLQTQVNGLISQLGKLDINQIGDMLNQVSIVMGTLQGVPAQLDAMNAQLDAQVIYLDNMMANLSSKFTPEVIQGQLAGTGAKIAGTIGETINGALSGNVPTEASLPAITNPIDINNFITIDGEGATVSGKEALIDAINGLELSDEEKGSLLGLVDGISAQSNTTVTVDSDGFNGAMVATMSQVMQDTAASTAQTTLEAAKYAVTAVTTNQELTNGIDAEIAQGVSIVATQELTALSGELTAKISEMKGMIDQAKALISGMTSTVNGILEQTKNIDFAKIGELGNKLPAASAGIQQLVDGGKALNNGAVELNNGIEKLQDASNKIVDATNQFKDATQKLTESTGELNDGVAKFSQEGIDQLDSKVNDAINELNDVMDIANTYLDSNNCYTSYGDSIDGITPSVKFVLKTKEIIKEENSTVVTEEVSQDTNLWQRIVNLFN